MRTSHIFMGCRMFGFTRTTKNWQSCKYYPVSENLFTICSSCHITVPKVCVSLGECVNCTDTDLFCVESCKGDENRKYCTHFIRLHTEGMHLIDNDQVFDLFPNLGMPGEKKSAEAGSPSNPGPGQTRMPLRLVRTCPAIAPRRRSSKRLISDFFPAVVFLKAADGEFFAPKSADCICCGRRSG